MKNKFSIIALAAFLWSSVPVISGQTNSPDPHAPTNSFSLLPVVAIAGALAGTAYVVYAYEKNNKNAVIPRLCLQRSPDNHAWATICTMTNVQLNGTNRIEIFRTQIDADPVRDSSFYRTMTP